MNRIDERPAQAESVPMRTIGVMAEFITGVYLGELVGALYAAARQRGVRLIAVRTGDLRGVYDYPLALDCADGWILVLNAIGPALFDRIVARGQPICCVGDQYPNPVAGSVRCDNRDGTVQALEALRGAGHTRFAYLGHATEPDIVEREEAFKAFLAEHGFDASPERFEYSDDYGYLGGHAAMGRLLARGIPFSAVFAGNDQNALGAIGRLREAGLRVPEDVAVIGFDNSPLARSPHNQIASVDQRISEMAALAVDDILARLDQPARAPLRMRLKPRFVPRRSAGMPAGPEAEEAEPIDRQVALSSIANSDEMNRFLLGGSGSNVTALLARLVPRLLFALVAQWDLARDDRLMIEYAAPTRVASTVATLGMLPVERFPLCDLGLEKASLPGELVIVLSTDALGGERFVIAIGAEADRFNEFELVLLMHELELIAVGIERMSAHQQLEREVSARTRELRRVNTELAQTLESLHATQKELVHAEKLASLGRLVAGVAHELNTPLGNAMVSISTIEEGAQRLRGRLGGGALRRSDLESLLDVVQQGCNLVTRSLDSVIQRVSDFRKISADQSSAQRNLFELGPLVLDVLRILRERHRALPVRFSLDPPQLPAVTLDSYPAPLSQVLLELADNAVLHGLADRAGEVVISCLFDGALVRLSVADDGVGVPEADRERIFDPFFTTRMGSSTGLGLSVVHNVVSGLLGGQVRAEHRPGGGTVVRVVLPLQAPVEDRVRA